MPTPATIRPEQLSHAETSWSCVEELQELMQRQGLPLQLLQLEGGGLAGSLCAVDLPPLRLLQIRLNRRLHALGPKPRGVLTVSLDLGSPQGQGEIRAHGQVLGQDCLFGLDLQREVHLTLPANVTLAILFFPLEALRQWAGRLHWPGFAGELLPSANVLRLHPARSAGLRRQLQQLFALARRQPARQLRPTTQRLLLEDLVPLLLEALGSGPEQPLAARQPARIDLVKETQRWLHAHPTSPISLTDLCRQAHASRRTLIQGFHDHLGMGPMAYLKLLRLHGVRRSLLEADPGAVRIGTLAAEWGFFNAGHFAADYRRLFAESPRDTLRRIH